MTNLHDGREYRARGWWRDGTFLDDLAARAAAAPDRPAVVSHFWETADGPDTVLTWAQLAERVERCAAGLAALGVRPGDRVAMQLVNQWQATVLALGCGRAGAAVVPYYIASGAADTEWILRESGAVAVVSLDEVRGLGIAATIAGMRDRLPALRHQIVVGGKVPEGAVGFEDGLLASDAAPPEHRPGGDDVFQIMYTSGTTGRPKGVRHSFNTLYAMARSFSVPLGLGPDDVLSTPCIVGGQGGWLYGMLAPLVAGATAVWADAFKPGDFLDLAAGYGITTAYFTPLILDELVAEQRENPRPLALRHMVTGSTPIPPGLPARFRETFGFPVRPLWGMTENGGVTIGRDGDPPDWAARSDGRPVDWMEVRLVGEDGAPVDGPGRLEVRGANLCLGYEGADDVFAASLHDGWFATGDLARPDGRGGIKIIGRTKDMINKGGLHVPAVAVEEVLRAHPRVAEIAVVGEPEPLLGETVVAVVVPDGEPPALEDLHRLVREAGMTPGYEPDRLEVVAALPKTPTGKVRKRAIEEELARRASTAAAP
ncbi:AMP-binding protein [Actinomadura montaniterrae]|uniref:AMP-binding protein n=1 Tax=Actinomadura montaniterrae TaxID=1803903 RepID=A0A6L3VLF7_9ACTN|nr:AMP-binding protein [Actinomadura montaniterrae]KAB2361005.1 AMP-binding protein [Actinomadura montaniterrae]